MRHVIPILSSANCPTVPDFSTLSHERRDTREKIIEHKMCVLIFCVAFVLNIPHSKKM